MLYFVLRSALYTSLKRQITVKNSCFREVAGQIPGAKVELSTYVL